VAGRDENPAKTQALALLMPESRRTGHAGSTTTGGVAFKTVSGFHPAADRRGGERDHGDDSVWRKFGRTRRPAAEYARPLDGIEFAPATAMSGTTVGRALRNRFDAIRKTEIERLNKKLRGLSDAERQSAEAIIHQVVRAIASVPEQALSEDTPAPALRALVHLFDLHNDPAIGSR
jgi:glutamyl-tRNAGlu reductase-like protein